MKLAALALGAVAALAGPVRADAKADVEAAVKAHAASFGQVPIVNVAKAGLLYLDAHEEQADDANNFGGWLTGGNFFKVADTGGITFGAMTVVIGADGKTAWFQAPATFKYKEYVGEGTTGWAAPRAVRVSGLMIDENGWKLARGVYTNSMTDKQLVGWATNADPPLAPATGPATITGDAAIAKVAETWFTPTGGFVKGASTSGSLAANGTAPSEFAKTPAAALKLAKGWDKLKLGAVTIDAIAFGKIGFVKAVVRLPVKVGKKVLATEMTLYAIVVDEGAAGWRWQSINWSPFT